MSHREDWKTSSCPKDKKSIANIGEIWATEADQWATREQHPLLAFSSTRKNAIEQALLPFEVELQGADRILDIGAGGGSQIYLPTVDTSKITAMDACSDLLQRNPAAQKVLADAREHFPFKDNSFDFVFQMFLNRYLENQVLNAQEIARVLRSGGRFLILDHTRFNHSQEVAVFDPFPLKVMMGQTCRDIAIVQLAPPLHDVYGDLYRGPLYLFTGVKK